MKIEENKNINNSETVNININTNIWMTKEQIEHEKICNLLDVDFFKNKKSEKELKEKKDSE